MKNLRNYQNFTIARKVNSPIIFLGFPLKLAMIYLGTLAITAMIAMFLSTTDVSITVKFVIPAVLLFGGVGGIRWFYTKYGIKGFHLQQRDKQISNTIVADKSILKLLRRK